MSPSRFPLGNSPPHATLSLLPFLCLSLSVSVSLVFCCFQQVHDNQERRLEIILLTYLLTILSLDSMLF